MEFNWAHAGNKRHMKFYKRDPDAALAGMVELTLQERGAYNSIIDLLYSRDGILADDADLIRRALGCHGNEWRTVKATLIAKGKLWVEDGYLKAKRVDSVIKEAGNFSETQRIRVGKRWETERKRTGKYDKVELNQQSINTKAEIPSTPTPTPTPKKEKARAEMALPEWLPIDAWTAFLEMRKKGKSTPTAYAIECLISDLERFRCAGDDPRAVLEASIKTGWRGLFALKNGKANGNGRQESGHEQTERVARELIAEFDARDAAANHGRDRAAGNSLPRLLAYDAGIPPGVDDDPMPGFGPQIAGRNPIRR